MEKPEKESSNEKETKPNLKFLDLKLKGIVSGSKFSMFGPDEPNFDPPEPFGKALVSSALGAKYGNDYSAGSVTSIPGQNMVVIPAAQLGALEGEISWLKELLAEARGQEACEVPSLKAALTEPKGRATEVRIIPSGHFDEGLSPVLLRETVLPFAEAIVGVQKVIDRADGENRNPCITEIRRDHAD